MRILDRYVLSQFLRNFVATLSVLILIFVFHTIWTYIDELAGRGLDAVGRSGTLWGFTALGALALGLMLASRRLRTLGPASQWEAAEEAP